MNSTELRESLLAHERNIRGVGMFFWIAAFLVIGTGLAIATGMNSGVIDVVDEGATRVVYSALLLSFGFALVLFGIGLFRLKAWSRYPSIACAVLGLPFWTVVSLVILYYLISPDTKRVLSDEYKNAVSETPEMRIRIPWIFLMLLVVGVLVVGFVIFQLAFLEP